jgi:hypothetical protein
MSDTTATPTLTAPSKRPGRPRINAEAGVRATFYVDPAEMAQLRQFIYWRQFKEGKDIALGRALFDALLESPTFQRFKADAPK